MNELEDAFRAAGGTIEQLVRAIVRDELRRHLGPEADHFLNIKEASMKPRKLRQLIRAGALRGYKHGRDVFVAASELRAYIQERPVERQRPTEVREPAADRGQDVDDELCIKLGIVPKDPTELRAFEARLAQRRAKGGELAASLRAAEESYRQSEERAKRQEERAARRAEKKRP